MTDAICFKCRTEKIVPLALCWSCKAVPTAKPDFAVSLVLSELFSTRSKLEAFGHDSRNGFKLAISEQLLRQAREALKKLQILNVLEAQAPKGVNKVDAQLASKTESSHT
jgi:hypothetical protein